MTGDAVTQLPDGALLGRKYRVERLLGAGGMGAVYLAENTDIGRKVAIKVLHPSFARDAKVLQRFRMEARAAGAIGHPGIVDVLDLGTTENGAEFIVMERLDGETLGARIKGNGHLRAEELVPIVCEVLEALAAAHDKGVIHRDLKPENIFLCARPVARAKILDFGISKFAGTENVSLTRTDSVMGTPMYMSPEQARGGKHIGPSTDLYAIGAILYEGLTGRPPVTGDSYNEVLANLIMEPHQPVAQVRPDLPAPLSALVDRLLAKNPADRPASAVETRELLRRTLGVAATEVDMPAQQHYSSVSSLHMSASTSSSVNVMAATMPPTTSPVVNVMAATMPPTQASIASAPAPSSIGTMPSTEPPAAVQAVQQRRKNTLVIFGALILLGSLGGAAAWWMTRSPPAAVAGGPTAPAVTAPSATAPSATAPSATAQPATPSTAAPAPTAAPATAPATPTTPPVVTVPKDKPAPKGTAPKPRPTITPPPPKPDGPLTIDQQNPY